MGWGRQDSQAIKINHISIKRYIFRVITLGQGINSDHQKLNASGSAGEPQPGLARARRSLVKPGKMYLAFRFLYCHLMPGGADTINLPLPIRSKF
jgi:hypothetical protein